VPAAMGICLIFAMMEQSKRQLQVAGVIEAELSAIFRKHGFAVVNNGMISILSVKVTPDLLEARIYLSFFQIDNPDEWLEKITERTSEWRGLLGNKLRNQLRRIPVLVFFKDDTLDHVFKMEEIFKQLEEERKQREQNPE
jgi:ribosome-binding factor A